MKAHPITEHIIYTLVVVLALAALWLVANAPADFLNAHAVYQGF
jgi:hypothetical protein